MEVAAAVASGLVETGLGVKSAARALNLDFVAVGHEEYDLIFDKSFFHSEKGQRLVTVIRSLPFKQAVERMEGYNTHNTGSIKSPMTTQRKN